MILTLGVISAPLAKIVYFLSVAEDVPLMTGLSEELEFAVEFESVAGRMVETFASGRVSQQDVMNFYKSSLPQLGWQMETMTRFNREGEMLELIFQSADSQFGLTRVHFKILPSLSVD